MNISNQILSVALISCLMSLSLFAFTAPVSLAQEPVLQQQKSALERGYRTGYSDGYQQGYQDGNSTSTAKRTIRKRIVRTRPTTVQLKITATVINRDSKQATLPAMSGDRLTQQFRIPFRGEAPPILDHRTTTQQRPILHQLIHHRLLLPTGQS